MRIPKKIGPLRGTVSLPGDKSIAHRALIHGALAMGDSRISHLPGSLDISSTFKVLQALHVPINLKPNFEAEITGCGGDFSVPLKPLDCGNSGTTMRLMMGVLAGCPFESILTGDESLSRRPMERVAEPLRMMGAKVGTEDGSPPVTIEGKFPLKPITYELPTTSAQVKSALIYAAAFADGESKIIEPIPSRDHTEIFLEIMCPENYQRASSIDYIEHSIRGPMEFPPFSVEIPGDPSSAAYLVALVLLIPDSEITITGLLLNPRRIRYLEIFKAMGGQIEITVRGKSMGEQVGDIFVKSSSLKNVEIAGNDIPLLIDEIPLFAVIATKAEGELIVRDAKELRYKESDRIDVIARNLRSLGCKVEEFDDGLKVLGQSRIKAARVEHFGDHRILMSLIVLSLVHELELDLEDLSPLDVSFPEFPEYIKLLSTG